jgi:hypothetical protein
LGIRALPPFLFVKALFHPFRIGGNGFSWKIEPRPPNFEGMGDRKIPSADAVYGNLQILLFYRRDGIGKRAAGKREGLKSWAGTQRRREKK